MPFSNTVSQLIGKQVSIRPEPGFGWRLTDGSKLIKKLDQLPGEFRAELADVLLNDMVVQAVICRFELCLSDRRFCWGYFGPRTELMIELEDRSVGCNILLSDTKPYLSHTVKFPAPEQVCTDSPIQLRGIGQILLEKAKGATP